jgi:DHA1 family tetracycline resistance protein-like MFS transporter
MSHAPSAEDALNEATLHVADVHEVDLQEGEAHTSPARAPKRVRKVSNTKLLTIFLVVFVDILGFGLILPLLPYYAEQFGATTWVTGLLVASYAAAQLIGAPLLGRLSDRVGRRPVLLLSIAGTAFGFLMLGLAEPLGVALGTAFGAVAAINGITLTIMFVSRMIDGITGGNISVAQAYITDVTDRTNRAQGLGLIGAAFGLGFILGPAVGGLLSTFGFGTPAYVAAAIATLNVIAVYFWLPESLTEERRREMAASERPRMSLDALVAAFRRPRVGPLLHTRFFFGLAFAMFQSIFSIYAAGGPLNLSPVGTGLVLAYVGLLAALVQGFAIGRLTKRFSESQLLVWSAAAMVAGFALWGFVPNVLTLLIVLIPLSLGGGILNTVLSSALTKVVEPEEVGGTLGLAASVESATRVIAPALGGVLLASLGVWGPALFCAILMFWVTTFIMRRIAGDLPEPTDTAMLETPAVVASH